MSVEPGAAAPPRDEDDFAAAGLEAFFAAADFEDFFAPDATRLAAAFTTLVDFFDLLCAIAWIHLIFIVRSAAHIAILASREARLQDSTHSAFSLANRKCATTGPV